VANRRRTNAPSIPLTIQARRQRQVATAARAPQSLIFNGLFVAACAPERSEPRPVPRVVRRRYQFGRGPMTDYRDPNSRLDMDRHSDVRSSNAMWGWIAGAVFLVLVLAVIFGLGGSDQQSATDTGSPPAATTGSGSGGTT